MQLAIVIAPLIVASVAGGGFIVNEWSHGGLSEAMGMGHHHMLDYGRQHCAAMNGDAIHMTQVPAHEGAHGDAAMPDPQGCAEVNQMMGMS